MRTPQTQTGLSLADGEFDGLTETICEIETEAQTLLLRTIKPIVLDVLDVTRLSARGWTPEQIADEIVNLVSARSS